MKVALYTESIATRLDFRPLKNTTVIFQLAKIEARVGLHIIIPGRNIKKIIVNAAQLSLVLA